MECGITMATLEELRKHIADLFAAAEDKNIISQAAVVSNKIDELEEEQKKEKEDYNKLLNDYKDVVLHSSFKPLNNSDNGAKLPSAGYQTLDNILDDAIKAAMETKKN